MNVAAIEPAMPRIAVSQKPDGPVPGVTALAISPATKPISIVQTQCSIGHTPLGDCVACRPAPAATPHHAPSA
jgi:hypothetical protein